MKVPVFNDFKELNKSKCLSLLHIIKIYFLVLIIAWNLIKLQRSKILFIHTCIQRIQI